MADLESLSHVFDPGNNLFTVKISGRTPCVIKNKKTGNQNSADYADMGLSSASSTSTIRSIFFIHLQISTFKHLRKYFKHHNTSTFYRLVVLAIEGKLVIFYQYNSTTELLQQNHFAQNQPHILVISTSPLVKNYQKSPLLYGILLGVASKFCCFHNVLKTLNNSYQHSPTWAEQNAANDFVIASTVVEILFVALDHRSQGFWVFGVICDKHNWSTSTKID